MKENTSPIFLGGFVRSGTSLLRAMISQHSNIAAGLETYWCEVDWEAGTERHGKPIGDWFRRMSGFYDVEIGKIEEIAAASDNVAEFLYGFLGAVAAREGKRRWAEKTTDNVIHLGRIYEYWPTAKFIHIVRDPRDCYVSLKQSGKLVSVENFADRWCSYLGPAETHKKTLDLRPDRYLELRYEDLARHPVETMGAVMDFVGESWEDRVAEFFGKPGEYEKVLELTGRPSSTLLRLKEPLTTKRIGIWKTEMSEQEIEATHEAIADRGLGRLLVRLENETPTH